MGCGASRERVHPSQLELPGQNYLGSCWQCGPESPLNEIPTWTKSCSGQLPTRAFDIHADDVQTSAGDESNGGKKDPNDRDAGQRVPHRNRATGKNNGFLLPSVHSDADGLEAFLSVFSDDDITVRKKVSTHIKLAVGLDGVGVGGGAEKSKRHGSGSRDMYVVCNVETYRLSVDLARAVKMIQHEAELRRERGEEPAVADNEPIMGGPSATSLLSSSSRLSARSGGGVSLYGVDPQNTRAYGDGCVTQVKCGGQLLIRVKQTNFGKQLEAWGASLELGLTAGGGAKVKGSGHRRKEGGDQKLNIEVHHNGGPALPKQFHDATISDIEQMVQTWADGLANDALLAVPMRVGVHRYDTLASLLLIESSPMMVPLNGSPNFAGANNNERSGGGDSGQGTSPTSPLGAPSSGIAAITAAGHSERAAPSQEQEEEIARLRADLADAQTRLDDWQENLDLLSAMVVAPARTAGAMATSIADGDDVPEPASPTTASTNQHALAVYVAKAASGTLTEVDLSQLPSGPEAVLWGSVCLMRHIHVIESLCLTNLRITDGDVPVLVHALEQCSGRRSSVGPPALRALDLSDNRLSCAGAASVVRACVQTGISGLEVFLENNWMKVGDAAALDAAVLAAEQAGQSVSR